MMMSVGDVLDRLSIVMLKRERSPMTVNQKEYEELLKSYNEYKETEPIVEQSLNILKKVNGFIWDYEAEIRQGMVDNDYEETGKRAILVRKFNSLRVDFKNMVNYLMGEDIKEIKHNHVSE